MNGTVNGSGTVNMSNNSNYSNGHFEKGKWIEHIQRSNDFPYTINQDHPLHPESFLQRPCTCGGKCNDHNVGNIYHDDDLILGELTYKDLWMYALIFMIMAGLILTLISVKGWSI